MGLDTYTLQAGDVVIFPLAPWKQNRARRYTILSVDGDMVKYTTSGIPECMAYEYTLDTLRSLGMTVLVQRGRNTEEVRFL